MEASSFLKQEGAKTGLRNSKINFTACTANNLILRHAFRTSTNIHKIIHGGKHTSSPHHKCTNMHSQSLQAECSSRLQGGLTPRHLPSFIIYMAIYHTHTLPLCTLTSHYSPTTWTGCSCMCGCLHLVYLNVKCRK